MANREWVSRREYSIQKRCERWGVPYEYVKRSAVFRRDKWICGICLKPVNRRLRWPDPMSKSLDHIIPLSVPGSPGHVDSNCQLAHVKCNSSKGGRNRV